jgi:hypothetical protein
MVVLEHALLLLKMTISGIVEDVPRWVQEKQAQEKHRLRHELASERMASYRSV